MALDLLARLRALPHAAVAFDALEGESAVHVVGGAVRDVVLERRPVELDLVVEGDAGEVARRAAQRLGGEATVHARFDTATVHAGDFSFDLASTRSERYPQPGALPEVETGATLEQDLARRDFTVNAMAIALADGHVTAHPDALADLEGRRLRVLHGESFRDDPTRLLRLCRYAARLGFAVAEDTAALAGAALAQGALESVSGDRLGRELRLLAREPQPAALVELDRRGLGARLLDPAFTARPHSIERAVALAPEDARADLLALASTLVGGDGERVAERLDWLGFQSRDRDRVAAAVERAPELAPRLGAQAAAAPSQLWELLAGETPETVALAGALAGSEEAADAVTRWFEHLRHVRPAITGHDLERAGLRGPAVGAGLRAAQAAALDDAGCGREEQLAAALAAARHPGRGV